ncbi:MAG TPA: transketolase C-terminal domain-containing protein [Levilinea sp.]|nr:transketolase C-terminal domain-containing protein [Levilinea sp.]
MSKEYCYLLPEIIDLLHSGAIAQPYPYAKVQQQATRLAYSAAMLELGESNPNVVVLDADVSKSIGTDKFAEKFPERSFNFGIAEQNMMAAAAGMATTGLIPFATTYAVFASLRALDQIRNTIHYPKLNVKIAASHSGITPGPDGVTHQGQEDISLLRAIANSTVIAPADSPTTKQAVHAAAEWPGPVYLSFTRDPVPFLFIPDFPFEIGKIVSIRAGRDVSIIAMRDMVAQALVAAARLALDGIDAQVLYCHTIKPLDEAAILEAVEQTHAVVTAENNVIFGGLGSAVAETLVENLPVPMKRIGVRDQFTESGPYLDLIRKYGLSYEFIEDAARQVIARKG